MVLSVHIDPADRMFVAGVIIAVSIHRRTHFPGGHVADGIIGVINRRIGPGPVAVFRNQPVQVIIAVIISDSGLMVNDSFYISGIGVKVFPVLDGA